MSASSVRPFVRTAALSVLAAAVLASAAAEAAPRVNATGLSCFALQDFIAANGAAIVRSASPYSGNLLSERYVANRGFCFANEMVRYRTVATTDTDRCTVLLCTERESRRRYR